MDLIEKWTSGNGRRAKSRFRLRRELNYKLRGKGSRLETGTGETIDIGSGGIAFVTDRVLPPGALVELSISWPVLLNQVCPLRLSVVGRILRSVGRQAVCTVDRYEFRTQSRTGQAGMDSRASSLEPVRGVEREVPAAPTVIASGRRDRE